MTFLGTLPTKEVEITLEDAFFEATKKRVHKSFDRLKSGSEQLYDSIDIEKSLDELNFQKAKIEVHKQYDDLLK